MTTKFKKGDKVRVLKTGICSARVTEGEIGIHTGNGHRVDFPHQSDWWSIPDAYLELVVQEPVEAAWLDNTGEMPVPRGTLVDVEHRNGDQYFSVKAGQEEAEDWSVEDVRADIVKWRPAKKDEKVVDIIKPTAVVLPHQDETASKEVTKQEEATMTLQAGDKVRIVQGIDSFGYGLNGTMRRAQDERTTLKVDQVDDDGEIHVDFPCGSNYSFKAHELELVSKSPKQEVKVKVDWKVGDVVRIKEDASYGFYANEQMKKAQREREVGKIVEVLSDRVIMETPSFTEAWTFEGRELEKLTEQEIKTMTTTTATTQAVEPKLVPFCVRLDSVTARQMNELLTLAVGLGANVMEAIYDDELDDDDVGDEFPALQDASKYYRENYRYSGVDKSNDTYTLDNSESFGSNVLTYEEAKIMLEGVKETVTTTGATKMTQQKPELKSFYVKLSAVDKDVERVNALLNRLVALGAERHDMVHGNGNESQIRREIEEAGGCTGSVCFVNAFNLFGLKKRDDKFLTYINDYKREWDDEAVEMTVEELEAYLNALEGKGRKPKGRPLRQRKVQIVYTNDKGYLLKNVIGVDIKADTGTVNVTYKQRKGKVIHNNNVVIPFSELKSVKFVGPNTIGAEYIFKDGKVVQVIQDFTHEAFTHKSH